MHQVATLEQIEQALTRIDPFPLLEAGFVAFSKGEVVIPPVGEMIFDKGDCHIKYGFIKGGDMFVVKIANYFPGNALRGRAADDGAVLLFDQNDGSLIAVLADRGRLTQLRTAVAGAIAARYLAPTRVDAIGIIGTGSQARLQLEQLARVTPCRTVLVHGRDAQRAEQYCKDVAAWGFDARPAATPAEVAASCNLIVTTTPSDAPLLRAGDIRPGTHITAMGSDSPGKQELDPGILGQADIVVVDSRDHASRLGELNHALKGGVLSIDTVRELGEVIADPPLRRTSDDQRTVADLVGLAVQDIQMAKSVWAALSGSEH